MTGRTLQEAIMMMIPEAWQKQESMLDYKRAFYEYHSAVMEPWDGPASITFTDGQYIGAVLDRNGLRPSRYYITKDDRVIMASEVGVLPIDPADVEQKGRLQPGRMFLVDFRQGRLIPDEEIKHDFSHRRPYAAWLRRNRLRLADLKPAKPPRRFTADELLPLMQAFGYTTETLQFMLLPMVQEKRDPVGSMGNDAALACLSDQPRLVYDYFKQMFAQVTNPPIDSIREEVIMSLECYIGPERNLLETSELHCQRLLLPHPILTNEELAGIKEMNHRGWRTRTIDITFARSRGTGGPAAGPGADLPRGGRGHRRRLQPDRAVRSSDRGRPCTGQRAAGLRCGAPPPGAAGQADPPGTGGRNGGSPRGASPLPAGRLRCRRDQSLHRVRRALRRPAEMAAWTRTRFQRTRK